MLDLGIGGDASFTSLPRQAGLYQQIAKAAPLLTAYGHTLTSQVSQHLFYPSIELSSASRLQTMAAALLANTKPDGYGKAQTSSPIVNRLLNQQLTLTSSADKTDKVTLLQLYHQNQKQQDSRLLAGSLTGNLVQAIRAQFCSSDAETLTAASSNFINRLASISNTIASGKITSDPLVENNVIWFFCAKHTATEIRTAMKSFFAKTTIRQHTFAADASNQAQVVKAYLRMLARPDYLPDNTEIDILCTSLRARQVHGSAKQLSTTPTKPSPTAAPVIPTTEDKKTALALPWWQHCFEGGSQFGALVERWWNSP